MANKDRLIRAEALFRFLSDQRVKETGAFSKGVNKGLNIARGAVRNEEICPTVDAVIDWDIIERLARAFPNSFISGHGEFIAHKTGECFILCNCETELDIKCKILEWFSRAAYKTEPYRSKAKNDAFHAYMLNGINQFLGTSFTHDDMEIIYTYLGNAIKHDKTVEFITQANYNMGFFRQFEN